MNSDDTLLIRGGTTSVGLAAASLAKSSLFNCAKIISTTRSEKKASTVKTAGATDVIIDSGSLKEQVMNLTDGKGATKCIELVGGTTLIDSCTSLAPNGVISMVGCVSGEWTCKDFDWMTALAPSKVIYLS